MSSEFDVCFKFEEQSMLFEIPYIGKKYAIVMQSKKMRLFLFLSSSSLFALNCALDYAVSLLSSSYLFFYATLAYSQFDWLPPLSLHPRNMILFQSINDYRSRVQLQNIPFVVVNNPSKLACFLETRTSRCTSARHWTFFPFSKKSEFRNT